MYQSQRDVALMMRRWNQPTRPLPTMIEDPEERFLAGKLIWSEMKELLTALGFTVVGDLVFDPEAPTDLVEVADGIGDVEVTLLGIANRTGLDVETTCFDEAHRTNMLKFWPDGSIHKRKSDKKVVKPPTFEKPDFAKKICEQPYLDYNLDGIEPANVVIFDDTQVIAA